MAIRNAGVAAPKPITCHPQKRLPTRHRELLIPLYKFDMETLNNRNTSNTTSHNTAQSSAIRNTGGRPRTAKGKARTKTLSTKLSVAEWKIVMKRVADSGKRPSVYLREVLLSGRVVAARTQEDRQQIRMLEGGCNNLNQLARMAHQQGVPYVRERLLSLLEGFNRLLSRI